MKTTPIKGTIFLSIATVVFMLSGYITNALLGRLLGPSSYGVYGIVISLISFVNIIQTTGVTQGVSKHISEGKANSDSILKAGFILQSILNIFFFILFFFFSGNIADLLKDRDLEPYIKICSFIFPLYGLYALFLDYYNGLHYFKKQAVMNITYSLSKLFFVLGLAYFYKLSGVFYAFILAPLLPLLFGSKFPLRKSAELFPIVKLLIFSLPLIGIAIFSNLLLSVDLFFVKIILPDNESVGFYTASQNIARLVFYSMSAFFLVIFPSISYAVSNNLEEKAKTIIQSSLRIIIFLITPMVIFMSATSNQLIELIYGSKYMESASSLSILLYGMAAFTLFTTLTYIISGAGKPYVSSAFSLIGLCITILLCFLLIPMYGLVGAAAATGIGSTVSLAFAAFFVFKKFHTFIPIKSFIRIIITSFIVSIPLYVLNFYYLLIPLLYGILFMVYVGILILLREFTKEDWKSVSSLVPGWITNTIKLK